jgi:predicted dehydrogenase
MKRIPISRRTFLAGTAAGLAGCVTNGESSSASSVSPNEKLNVAAIGCGGKGSSDINECRAENIVALCDVDDNRAGQIYAAFPKAKQYRDFRVMLEKHPEIDAVTVSTPDHTHAIAALTAMEMGKHVYVQKPLTHNIYEARLLTEAARKYGVVTQMGNQGHSGEGTRRCVEMIQSGAIGQVREVHCWTDRPGVEGNLWWPQAVKDPYPAQPVRDNFDWDLWLSVAKDRPYHDDYCPFNWRGWWDYGSCALGDMACHIMDSAYWALNLGMPESVEVVSQKGCTEQTGPLREVIRYEFGARGDMAPVTVYWYDGGNLPKRPDGIPAHETLGNGENGSLFVGDDGFMSVGTYGGNPRLHPMEKMKEYEMPEKTLPRVAAASGAIVADSDRAHRLDWIQACKGGTPACSNFDYSGPFTEMVLLGTIAVRVPGKLLWDGKNARFSNSDAANRLVRREYRSGWELPKV